MLKVKIEKKLDRFDLDIDLKAKDEIIGLLGDSGSGKSLTLKTVAGIFNPDKGYISVNSRTVLDTDKKICIRSKDRHVGYMFQNYALFPHMTAFQNIMCCLSDGTKKEKEKRTSEILETFHLSEVKNLYPNQLSGGQQQRTALARMMSVNPECILLDEPFSALDTNLRWQLEIELVKFLKTFDGTTVLVTHNKDEAYRICDTIAVISEGRIVEIGDKKQIFERPRSVFSAAILGKKNIAGAIKKENCKVYAPKWDLNLKSDYVPEDAGYICLPENKIRLFKKNGDFEFDCVIENIVDDAEKTVLFCAKTTKAEHIVIELSKYAFDLSNDTQINKFAVNDKITAYYSPKDILFLK